MGGNNKKVKVSTVPSLADLMSASNDVPLSTQESERPLSIHYYDTVETVIRTFIFLYPEIPGSQHKKAIDKSFL